MKRLDVNLWERFPEKGAPPASCLSPMKGLRAPPVTGGLFYDANAAASFAIKWKRAAKAHGELSRFMVLDLPESSRYSSLRGGQHGSEERGRGGGPTKTGGTGAREVISRLRGPPTFRQHHARGRFQQRRRSHQPSGRAGGDAPPERLFRCCGAGQFKSKRNCSWTGGDPTVAQILTQYVQRSYRAGKFKTFARAGQVSSSCVSSSRS